MGKGRKKKPASRMKYEQNHPVVSARVDRQLYNTLQAIKETEGLSNADLLKIAAGKLEVKIREEKEIWRQGYDEGQLNGFELAESIFKITYPCGKCKRMMEVDTEEEKEAIRKFMIESGWCHGDCNNP